MAERGGKAPARQLNEQQTEGLLPFPECACVMSEGSKTLEAECRLGFFIRKMTWETLTHCGAESFENHHGDTLQYVHCFFFAFF